MRTSSERDAEQEGEPPPKCNEGGLYQGKNELGAWGEGLLLTVNIVYCIA